MPQLAGYYRHPTVRGDQVVFVCEDDLFSVSLEGGPARRLTSSPAPCESPRLSPDGRWIAFTAYDDGPPDVHVMPAEGGPPVRRTWFGSKMLVTGWHGDGRIVAASGWRMPFRKLRQLVAVDPVEGVPEVLPYGHASHLSFAPRGDGVVLGRSTGDPARWKRYRGGTAGTLWIDREGDGAFEPLVKLAGNLASPMWIGRRVYFLSDHEGHGNLYSCTPAGRGLRRHTDHQDHYARAASTDGRTIVYQAGANLWAFDVRAGEARRIDVTIASPRPQRRRRFLPPERELEEVALHPQGHTLASVHRGGVHVMGLWEGASICLDPRSSVRYRLARFLPDGERVVAVSDERGEEGLVVARADGGGRRRRLRAPRGGFGRVVDLAVSPTTPARVALTNHRHELFVVDVHADRARRVDRSRFDRIAGVSWSPDGRWLAYALPDGHNTSSLAIHEVARGRTRVLDLGHFLDFDPVFDPTGRYLYFLSKRTFDPVYDDQTFDLGFPHASRPYLLPLWRDLPSPFEDAQRATRPPGAPPAHKPGDKPPRVRIDFRGVAERVVSFPVPRRRYVAIHAAHGGGEGRVLLASYLPGTGARGLRLDAWELEAGKLERVGNNVTGVVVSADAKVVGLLRGHALQVAPSTVKAGKDEASGPPGRESGLVDWSRVKVPLVPGDEWAQMFDEAWRLQRDHYWTEDMAGVDWQGVHARYRPLVERVATRAEFSDLMWEMQGELGTSHCYEMGGDYQPWPRWFTGQLGADLELDGRGHWRIVRLPRGDPWRDGARAPLLAPGLDVREGDRVVAVDGVPVDATTTPEELLVHRAGRAVSLTIRPGPSRAAPARPRRATTISVRTLRTDRPLRYRDWVERNRALVHRRSRGRVGYVHVPDMGPEGFAEFHRAYQAEFDREGLIVDVRFNGGGHVSQLLLQKLAQRRLGYDLTRWGEPQPYPLDAPKGAMVALTNEYAGSDGDIFSHAFKMHGLGPLIGTRTWGGVIGIWPRHALVDGTVTTQPEFAFWFEDVEWSVENYGTDPDIEVEVTPQDAAAGRDPQLERGLREVTRVLRERPGRLPRFGRPPSLRAPRLPRR